MNKESCFELGYIEKGHGLEGAVLITLDVDDPSEYKDLESVFVDINNKLIPFFVEEFFFQNKNKAVIYFEDLTDRDSADKLKGHKLYLPLEALPKLEGDKFYFHEIIGYQIYDVNIGLLGNIEMVYEAGHQNLIAVIYEDVEILIPIADEILTEIDKKNKKITVKVPEGLIDVYLNAEDSEEE